ncbi:MAG: aminotransferase class I/II-fold pyridoxal phosphate-dependent enzyme, partial [Nitrospira sp.]|nr:aminotransferase class I/II-fold pyridoxal phosphate-dependent enzyme [Nitrospira sp.]
MAYQFFQDLLQAQLEEIRSAGLFKSERQILGPQGARIRVAQGEVINLCANNYLGLANHPQVVQAAEEGLRQYGFGMASVRFICGTQDQHKQLEEDISRFLGTEDTILYTSCFDANTGLFETILNEEDAIISDALNHASLIDG